MVFKKKDKITNDIKKERKKTMKNTNVNELNSTMRNGLE